jgi:murein DD-endopeptidase MepM/ murein hydrolase activator NlpD
MTTKQKKGLFVYGSASLFLLALVAIMIYVTYDVNRQAEHDLPPEGRPTAEHPSDETQESPVPEPDDEKEERYGDTYQFKLYEKGHKQWIKASELAIGLGGSYRLDSVNRVLDLTLFNVSFTVIDGVPVLERSGMFLPFYLEAVFDLNEEEVYLPLEFLVHGLEVEASVADDGQFALAFIEQEALAVFATWEEKPLSLAQLSPDELISYLSFLSNPLPGASISTRESHLPGARRAYRNGYHEGIDWYSGTSGMTIDLNTPVVSVADGVVVRADRDYVEMTREERDADLLLSSQLPDTPTYILDRLRGRSVWVQYENGVMIRFVHLSRIEDGIEVGVPVKRGQTLGYVGNSGTSYAIDGDEWGGLHLHADLLIYGDLFWKYIDQPAQIRRVLENIFAD